MSSKCELECKAETHGGGEGGVEGKSEGESDGECDGHPRDQGDGEVYGALDAQLAGLLTEAKWILLSA